MRVACGRLATPVLGGLLLAAATPPAWFPGAEFLVLPGLALWYCLATDGTRPLWHSYLFGCVHMAWFSWSVRHVLLLAYGLIVILGGLYYLAASAAVRQSGRGRLPAFAIAVGAVFWLRAVMPEICYPHGQPCHCLWSWPSLLGGVVLGGEALANLLLAALAAASVDLVRSWRLAAPPWSGARTSFLLMCVLSIASAVGGRMVLAVHHGDEPARTAPGPSSVTVAAIEPGFHLMHELAAMPRERQSARLKELLAQRLLEPTRQVLAGPAPPELVLWPESSVFDEVTLADLERGAARLLVGALPASSAHLLLGANVFDGQLPTPAAVQLELPSGRVLGYHEKRHLVPGGEFQPFVAWLPQAIGDALLDAFALALGTLPQARPGSERRPLSTRSGVRFGALLCYDNAFAGPAAAQVAMGARWLCVLSNEAWYEGGGELAQLMAMTVMRALEVGAPIVRCTQDGWTGWVDGSGVLRQDLGPLPSPQPGPRILRVDVPLGPGRLPPMAWLRASSGPALGLGLLILLLHGVRAWARLSTARTASRTPTVAGLADRGSPGSGS